MEQGQVKQSVKLKKVNKNDWNYFSLISRILRLRFQLVFLMKQFFPTKKELVLSISNVSGRYQQINGFKFSKFSDSLKSIFYQSFSLKEVVLEWRQDGNFSHPAVSIDPWIAMILLKRRISKENIFEDSDISEFLHTINKNFEIELHNSETFKYLDNLVLLISAYSLFLKVIRPKIVFVGCFYSPAGFAVTYAANTLGIKTVEVQHGQQGNNHGMYTNWNRMPKEGYRLLPEYFWMWGNDSANRLRLWTDQTDYHKVVVGGNPWLAYYKNLYQSNDHQTHDFFRKLEVIRKKKKVMLVSLQPLPDDDCIPEFLCQVLREEVDYFWCLRLHPRMISLDTEIKKMIGYDDSRHEIKMSSQTQLYDLLSHVDLNITYWSTVAYEALHFGVHSIIVHETGLLKMKDYIERGHFAYAHNRESLLCAINGDFLPEEEPRYIESDIERVRKTIRLIT